MDKKILCSVVHRYVCRVISVHSYLNRFARLPPTTFEDIWTHGDVET